ncbi:MAG: ATP phosphoribosyltransferase regulatory subunit [Oscillospiraceae bacterium]|nr:ATP phosphoribosyltransferase regulatory subunit [Oscillospiraceae bacterium]
MDQTILKTEEQAIFALRSLYRRYGYLPYKMSKFEEYEYYIRNKDFLVSDRIITFNDTNGRLLALKPDVTLSIIKNCLDLPGCKQKVCYNENIYRVSESTHQYKEIMQAGLECIGDIDLYDICEAVSLAAQSLALISEDFVLQISHLGILSAVLDRVCPDPKFHQAATACIAGKNAHDLSRLCQEYGVTPENEGLLTGFVSVYGERRQVLARLEALCGTLAAEPLKELKRLSRLLESSPHSEKIIFDFSVVNNMGYYNGIVFKGYLSGICDGILDGGQYDKLMQKMERKSGAIGFALYLDLLEQLPAPKHDYDVDVLLLYGAETDPAAVAEAAARLIAEGKTVSAQKAIPPKLRHRELLDLRKEGAPC